MKKINFIVIGAQKSGTTTLHKHLESHPEIYVPPEKEAIYFSDKERLKKGFEWYYAEFFKAAKEEHIIGKVTPHYMGYPESAEEIKRHNPEAKIIAILRDPIDRAESQYKMNIKRGLEKREINATIQHCLKPENLVSSRNNPTELNTYVTWGEYSRILKTFQNSFNENQILVIRTNDLEERPTDVMKKIFIHIGVTPIEGLNFNKKYHVGGYARKIKTIDELKKIKALKTIWRKLLPFKLRRRVGFWLDQWNTASADASPSKISKENREALKEHYKKEYELIETQTLDHHDSK